jgi:hypothetical protein
MLQKDNDLPEEDILVRAKNHFGLESTSKVTSWHIFEMIGIMQKSLASGSSDEKANKAKEQKDTKKRRPRKTKDERLQEIIDRITSNTAN